MALDFSFADKTCTMQGDAASQREAVLRPWRPDSADLTGQKT